MAQNVSDQVALQVMEEQKEFPGVTAQVQPVIDYPQPDGANPAQVLGYLQPATQQEIASEHLPATGFSGVDLVGQAGLEAQYDSQLRGQAGTQVVSVNAAGDVTGTVGEKAPVNGDDLVTSINAQLQADVQNALAAAIARSRAEGNDADQGAAIVMTTTGRVVAMASYPNYNPSVWTGGISQQEFNDLFGTERRASRSSTGPPRASTRPAPPSRSPRPRPRWPTATRWTACTTAPPRSASAATPSSTTASRASAT